MASGERFQEEVRLRGEEATHHDTVRLARRVGVPIGSNRIVITCQRFCGDPPVLEDGVVSPNIWKACWIPPNRLNGFTPRGPHPGETGRREKQVIRFQWVKKLCRQYNASGDGDVPKCKKQQRLLANHFPPYNFSNVRHRVQYFSWR